MGDEAVFSGNAQAYASARRIWIVYRSKEKEEGNTIWKICENGGQNEKKGTGIGGKRKEKRREEKNKKVKGTVHK